MKNIPKQTISYRPSWLAFFHPNLTLGLIIIGLFLSFIAVLSLFGIYDAATKGNSVEMMQSGFRMLLYAVPAYGIFRLKKWARKLELFLSVFLVILAAFLVVIYLMDNNESALLVMGIVIMIIHGSIAKYLLSAKCRQVFGLEAKTK